METYKCQFDISSFRKTDINGRVSRNSYLGNLTPSILSPTSPLPFLSHVRVLYNTLYCFRSMRRSAVSCHRFIASARPVRHHQTFFGKRCQWLSHQQHCLVTSYLNKLQNTHHLIFLRFFKRYTARNKCLFLVF